MVIGDGDGERDQQGLGDAAVGEPVLGVAEVEIVGFESAADPFGVGPDGAVSACPGGVQVGKVLAELVRVSEIVGVQGDGLLRQVFGSSPGLLSGAGGRMRDLAEG